MTNENFSKILIELRKEKKYNQRMLAKELNVSQATIALWETNKRKPDIDTIKTLAEYFNVSTDYLLGLENEDFTKTYDYSIEKLSQLGFDKEKLKSFDINSVKTSYDNKKETFDNVLKKLNLTESDLNKLSEDKLKLITNMIALILKS